jgi:hypothetical protein
MKAAYVVFYQKLLQYTIIHRSCGVFGSEQRVQVVPLQPAPSQTCSPWATSRPCLAARQNRFGKICGFAQNGLGIRGTLPRSSFSALHTPMSARKPSKLQTSARHADHETILGPLTDYEWPCSGLLPNACILSFTMAIMSL